MITSFTKLIQPTAEIVESLNRWENDPELIPVMRPNPNQEALESRKTLTVDSITRRLEHDHIYLIHLDGRLIGEMNFQVDPAHLFRREAGTAWIGITIGEKTARGRGIGRQALEFLEAQISQMGLKRIELGVFEFNTNAIRLYQNLGYVEFGRIEAFTYWQGKMWQDIRMEKYV